MIVQLKIDSGKLTFDPPFRELRDILLRLLTDIVQNAEDLPRVSRTCCAGIVGSNFLVALSSHRGYVWLWNFIIYFPLLPSLHLMPLLQIIFFLLSHFEIQELFAHLLYHSTLIFILTKATFHLASSSRRNFVTRSLNCKYSKEANCIKKT